ncbi:REP element-mobilizing transposase RayT [Marinoscillum furvescens DSM 4134]|uniref:REP element-mobilizing transposase RayT n=1 Tax=Marinoscillum furvescens DSM 4134 TaxID=1122208 RepID=A0A3D9KZ12_MARFU|nr:REP element-mobilizing transposase RayT [Marinoscillum furvescens DSM 4134]
MPDYRTPLEPDEVYHVYTHATGADDLFRTAENGRYFLEKYAERIHPVAQTYAYCLMPNHVHLMIRVRSVDELLTLSGFQTLKGLELSNKISQQFAHLFNGYTQAYNKMYDRKGALFRSRFYRKHIDNAAYFTKLMAYIHYNPVHHKFVKSPDDWLHSSWHSYFTQQPTRISREEALSWFGDLEDFRKFHEVAKRSDISLPFED